MKRRLWWWLSLLLCIIYMLGLLVASVHPAATAMPGPVVAGEYKIPHIIAYAVFAILLLLVIAPRLGAKTTMLSRLKPYIITILLANLYGGFLELLQVFLPYRTAALQDLLANFIGVVIGLILIYRAMLLAHLKSS